MSAPNRAGQVILVYNEEIVSFYNVSSYLAKVSHHLEGKVNILHFYKLLYATIMMLWIILKRISIGNPTTGELFLPHGYTLCRQ